MNWFKNGRNILIAALGLVLILLVFRLGEVVGFHKARFSFNASEGYYRVFQGNMPGGPRPSMGFQFQDLPGGHGATGRIVDVSLPTFVVASPDNVEKTVFIGTSTMIRRFREVATSGAIRSDDFVTVLGTPDQSGFIQAKLIRIVPTPTR